MIRIDSGKIKVIRGSWLMLVLIPLSNPPSNQVSTMLVVSPVIEEAAKLLSNHEMHSMHYCNPPTATTLSGERMEPESCFRSSLKPNKAGLYKMVHQTYFQKLVPNLQVKSSDGVIF